MAELPIAPGQPYVEVEYDYEYKSKDRLISIHQGECYLLLKKTNDDWWQVRRDEGTKPFYVPAQYVRETRKALMPPPKPVHGHSAAHTTRPTAQTNHPPAQTNHPPAQNTHPPAQTNHPTAQTNHSTAQTGASLWVKPTNLDLSESLPRRESGSRRSSAGPGAEGSPLHSPHHGPPEPDRVEVLVPGAGNRGGSNSSTLPRSRARSPDLQRAPLDVDSHYMDSGEDRRTNESESGDDLSSSSTEHLQTVPSSGVQLRSESPVYTNLQELKGVGSLPPLPSGAPLSTVGDWDTYKDPGGRLFYVHHSTHERTWKPPRGKEQGIEPVSLALFPLLSLSEDHSAPFSLWDGQCGWSEETDESGLTLYICDFTNETWLKNVDDQGREYYYSADGSRSEWELPKFNHSPPPHLSAEGAKTRSLDRKQKQVEPIVLTKSWRHSTHFPEPNEKPSEKCGVLNMTKITEHGKKVRKNWQSQWTVLHGSTLLFAKGQGGGSSWFGGGQSKPELTVDLRGGAVEWASKDKSSKKHVLELKTRQGTELLIQSENEGLINDWFRTLQDCVSSHAWESDEAIEEDMPESPGREEKIDKEKEHRDSKKGRAAKNSTSTDPTENKKTRHKLKKFLTRRPTLQAVKDKGYIKDQVFGCSLSSLCQREGSSVPHFVKMCIDHVETTSLKVDGLYRVSGNLSVIQKLRFAVNHDEKVTLSDNKWEDIHVTTGALKMFFRELPEPLFTYTLFQDFVSAIKSQDYKQRVLLIKDLVRQLPKPNHDTMQALFRHLHKVVDHGEDNRMTIQSVAIVFGPTLLRPETETWNMAVHMVYQNQIVELCLMECENIFGR